MGFCLVAWLVWGGFFLSVGDFYTLLKFCWDDVGWFGLLIVGFWLLFNFEEYPLTLPKSIQPDFK